MMSIYTLKEFISLYLLNIVTLNMLTVGDSHSFMVTAISLQISDCRKIFNNLTGTPTPIDKLNHKDKWFSYLRSILNRLALRESIKQTGIDLKTAFRWYQMIPYFSGDS
ncbi:MAG: transposase [Arsenophonus sp. NEOnobi-MAG3]